MPRAIEGRRSLLGSKNADKAVLIDPEIEVSVVLPCLNEAETVGWCIRKELEGHRAFGARGEVIVSDSGSQDGSPKIAHEAGARVRTARQRREPATRHSWLDARVAGAARGLRQVSPEGLGSADD